MRLRPAILYVVCIGLAAWRLGAAATAVAASDPSSLPGEFLARLTESRDVRLDRTLGAQADLVREMRRRTDDGPLAVYTSEEFEGESGLRVSVASTMIRLHGELSVLLFPRRVKLWIGRRAAPVAALETVASPFYVANLSPQTPLPAAERFRSILGRPGFSLHHFPVSR